MPQMTEHSVYHRLASSSSSSSSSAATAAVQTKAKSPKQVSVNNRLGANKQNLPVVVAYAAKQPSPLFLAARHWTRCSRLPVQNTQRLGHLFRCSRSSQHVFLGNRLNEGRQKAKRRLSTITLSTLLLILPLFQKHLVSTSKSDNTNSASSQQPPPPPPPQQPPSQRYRQQQQQPPPPPLPQFTTITNDFIPIDQQRMMLFSPKHNTAGELAIADFNIDNEILGKINNVFNETTNMLDGQMNNNKNGTDNDHNNNNNNNNNGNPLEFNLFGIKFDPKMPLLQSAKNRQGLVKHIFNEFHEKTLSLQATNAAGLGDETGVALATGTANQQLPINSSHPLVNSSTMLGSNAADSATADELQEHQTQLPAGPRPFFGDVFQSFFAAYLPYHCVIGLVICCLGIFANITNIIVLTRPNMITAVNTILCAMAFSDLVVNISNIGFLTHGLLDATNLSSFYSLPWAIYILLHAHASVTGHTISMWLTCLLATWRYFVVCRSQSNQRNWSVRLALRIITAVLLLVPIFCIPNYLAFDIDVEIRQNMTLYTVGFSSLAKRVQVFKTLHFWIFSCLTKLLPCFLLTFFTTALIRKLLSARERRLRLATYGGTTMAGKEDTESAADGPARGSGSGSVKKVILSESHLTSEQLQSPDGGTDDGKESVNNVIIEKAGKSNDTRSVVFIQGGSIINESGKGIANIQVNQHRNSSCATNPELIALSCNSSECGSTMINNNNNNQLVTSSSKSDNNNNNNNNNNSNNNNNNGENKQQVVNQARILTQLIVARTPTSETISTTVAPCQTDTQFQVQSVAAPYLSPSQAHDNQHQNQHTESPRSASTCGALDFYGASTESVETKLFEIKPLARNSRAASQEFPQKIINNGRVLSNSTNIASDGNLKFSSNSKRSSAAMTPTQLVKLQAAQRQLSHNETTTRLLIAVMIVFVICEFPAGVLAALCAVFGEGFFENVYQPVGHLTDLLALINSSVNFILYCCMSTQFRKTFYKVVLRC